jgi:hypothetical protein
MSVCYANNDIVREVLDSISVWIDDYTSSEDYGGNYAYIAFEDNILVADRVNEWVRDAYSDFDEDTVKLVVDYILDRIDDADCECEYDRNEYAAYRGNGCCIYSLEVGECEETIELSCYPELAALYDSGDIEACLSNYNGDLYISANDYYDRELGRRVHKGYVRKGFNGNNPYLVGYGNPGGQWHYVISDDSLNQLVFEALESKEDCND